MTPVSSDAAARNANIAERLRIAAAAAPEQAAVILPARLRQPERRLSFAELDRDADRIAAGLIGLGVRPGHRIVLMVRPGIEFTALTFGLFRAGAVAVLIDPGMGLRRVFACLAEIEPDGFAAVPAAHLLRRLRRRRFPAARFNVNVCVGRNWFRDSVGYSALLASGESILDPARSSPLSLGRGAGGEGIPCAPVRRVRLVETGEGTDAKDEAAVSTPLTPHPSPEGEGDHLHHAFPLLAGTDPAAVIFTSGGTGPPKGVVYEHAMFAAQVDLIRDRYDVRPGEIDLPGFPLFALFDAAMQVTMVVPDMNPTRPAWVDPRKILDPIRIYRVTQAFGSPALWNRVGRHCEKTGETIPHLRRALSAGAPVPVPVLARLSVAMTEPGAEIHTPYGATEALPVATITASEILGETAAATRRGAGTCVGRPFPQVDVRIVAVTDGPIASMAEAKQLPFGDIGEIVVRSPSATREYFRRPVETALAKIPDGDSFWHRMGDVGYLDESGRLWFCGRKAHVVETPAGPMYSVCCEAIFNTHPDVYRSALVGLGPRGEQEPVIVVESEPGRFPRGVAETIFADELRGLAASHPLTECITTVLFHPAFPVDVRHNIKIDRGRLARWAALRLARRTE